MFRCNANELNSMLGNAKIEAPINTAPAARRAIHLVPQQVIFNPPATIVYWQDGTKTVVRCDNDEFSEEFGYAMACMRKIYGTRAEFKAQFKNAYRPYLKKSKAKKEQTPVGDPPTEKAPVKCNSVPTLNQMLRDLAGNDSVGVQIAFKIKDPD